MATRYFQDPATGQVYRTTVGADRMSKAAGGYVGGQQYNVPIGFYQILPFYLEGVAAGAQVNVNLNPQRTFRVDALVIDSLEGGFFTLDSWNVAQNNMFVAQGRVRATVFSEVAAQRGLNLRGFTANQGAQITLQFTNTDTAAHTLSFMLCGPSMIDIG